jgi:leader peptidase (prepilin peptidase)/N-methyltransferase
LLAAIGAWLGWQMLPVTLLLSSVVVRRSASMTTG